MFAVFEDGGRQYKASVGDVMIVDYRKAAQKGDTLTFDKILIANGGGSSAMGKPHLEGASVVAEVTNELFKAEKLEIQKHRRRHHSRRHTGHRQKHTLIKITGITIPNLEIVTAPPAPQA